MSKLLKVYEEVNKNGNYNVFYEIVEMSGKELKEVFYKSEELNRKEMLEHLDIENLEIIKKMEVVFESTEVYTSEEEALKDYEEIDE